MSPAVHVGVVRDYDPRRGLGALVEDASGTAFSFHCTAIAGGSRQIAVGTAVTYVVAAAHGGQFEARSVTPERGR